MSGLSSAGRERAWLDAHINTTASALIRELPRWASAAKATAANLASEAHGDLSRWASALDRLPPVAAKSASFGDRVSAIGTLSDTADLSDALGELKPWRKGPFELIGVHIDTEWRSDWKWQRLAPHLAPLTDRRVLDIGCGNGYYGWRMLDAGAHCVVGVDPTLLFVLQHAAVCRFMPANLAERNLVLPLRLEEAPSGQHEFDSVFSMGVLYHRRDPVEHLRQLAEQCRNGGEIVLETLVTTTGDSFVPEQRYARMRNVWCIPNLETLNRWCADAGLQSVRCVDVTKTSTDEQRSTDWMTFESLDRCLDPNNPDLTIEGYPAPHRAIVLASPS